MTFSLFQLEKISLQDNIDLKRSESELKLMEEDIERKHLQLGDYDIVSIQTELQQLIKKQDMMKEKVDVLSFRFFVELI